MRWTSVKITKSDRAGKKLKAKFKDANNKCKTVHFGEAGAPDYTKVKKKEEADKKRKAYLARHKTTENWNNPATAGALSRWILWEHRSRAKAIREFKKKFKLK